MSESSENNNRWYPQYPMVAVSAIVLKEGRMLLVKRAKEPSKGKWSIPGGKLELGETIYEVAKREVLEECSIKIEIMQVFNVMDDIIRDEEARIRYHFVLIDLLARYTSGETKAQSDAKTVVGLRSRS